MTRRRLYPLAAEWLAEAGDARIVLTTVADAMRLRRNLPVANEHAASGKKSRCFIPAEELARNSELSALLDSEDALGQIYQALSAPALEAAYRATARERRKFSAAEIPAVTQLFTPRWVVEFLLHNTLGRLWMERHPDSELKSAMRFLIPEALADEGYFHRKSKTQFRAGEIRICDPACGTMNFGLVAAELLAAMYREEAARAGCPGWPEIPSAVDELEIAAAITRRNIVGIDIDPIAIELARVTLEMKLRIPLSPSDVDLRLADALFDEKIERTCSGQFDVVVTNPPYLTARNLPPATVAAMKKKYPSAWRDACACFLSRGLDFLKPLGRAGILTMQSFMFTGGFERLRKEITDRAAIEAIAHFGPGLFDVGNPGTLQTAAVVLREEFDVDRRGQQKVAATRLVESREKEVGLTDAIAAGPRTILQRDLTKLPRGSWAYWADMDIRRIFDAFPALQEIAPPRQGLATTDNARFVRYWWEVEIPGQKSQSKKWIPYAKGGRFRRWHEAARHRVNWEDDGREIKASIVQRYPYLNGQWEWVAKNSSFYGRGGVTYSYLTSGPFSARVLQPGAIFDVAGSSLFPEDPLTILAVLNSSVARRLLNIVNPTVNFQVGDLNHLPMPRAGSDELRAAVAAAIEVQRQIDSSDPTSTDFVAPLPWNNTAQHAGESANRLKRLERQIDKTVNELYGMPPVCERAEDPNLKAEFDRKEAARQWIHFAIGNLLNGEGSILWLGKGENGSQLVALELARLCGDRDAHEIAASVGGIGDFLCGEFCDWHARLFCGRPIFWTFAGSGRTCIVSNANAEAALLRPAIRRLGGTLPRQWQRSVDDGIQINLAPLTPWVAGAGLAKTLAKVSGEIEAGRYPFAKCCGPAQSKTRRSKGNQPRIDRRMRSTSSRPNSILA